MNDAEKARQLTSVEQQYKIIDNKMASEGYSYDDNWLKVRLKPPN